MQLVVGVQRSRGFYFVVFPKKDFAAIFCMNAMVAMKIHGVNDCMWVTPKLVSRRVIL